MKAFTIEYEIDLYEKLDGRELGDELAEVFQVAQSHPSSRHALWEHPEGSVLFLIYNGPEINAANQAAFDAAVLKRFED